MSGEVSGFNHEGHEGPRRKPLRIQPLCNFVPLVVHEIRTELSALTSSSLCKYWERGRGSTQFSRNPVWKGKPALSRYFKRDLLPFRHGWHKRGQVFQAYRLEADSQPPHRSVTRGACCGQGSTGPYCLESHTRWNPVRCRFHSEIPCRSCRSCLR